MWVDYMKKDKDGSYHVMNPYELVEDDRLMCPPEGWDAIRVRAKGDGALLITDGAFQEGFTITFATPDFSAGEYPTPIGYRRVWHPDTFEPVDEE